MAKRKRRNTAAVTRYAPEPGRIERKPEYDAEDWEAVGKLKAYVEGRGFTFKEQESDSWSDCDCMIEWQGDHASRIDFRKSIPGIVEPLKNLKFLTRIDISNTVEDLRWLCELGGIQDITFFGCDDKKSMDRFRGLDSLASANTIQNVYLSLPLYIPDFIRQFRELRFLILFHAPTLLTLPDWLAELPKLERLNLHGSHIQSIPYSLVKTGLPFVTDGQELPSDGRYIDLRDVTLVEGDISIFSKSREYIEEYYRGGQSRQAVRECKVIFLGEGSAGKSSLIDRIEHPKKPYDSSLLQTNGVSVTKWNTRDRDGDLSLRVLDFGGQEIMHSMHRCFLTEHTVYVIVCESRIDGNVDLEAAKWLETVREFAPNSSVILALNKADLNPNVSVNRKDLEQRNHMLKAVLKTTIYTDRDSEYGVKHLEDAILAEVPHCMDNFLANGDILGVKRELEDMVENDKDYFTAKQYQEICRRHHIEKEETRTEMLKHFRELGVVYYYDPDGKLNPDAGLDVDMQNIRVLNPAWLTNGIYRLILWTPEGGFLKRSEIRKLLKTTHEKDVLKNKRYTGEEVKFVLHVMEMEGFEISLNIGNGVEMIPLKMPKTPPDSEGSYPYGDAIHLRWEASYLPDNLVHRLIIRMYEDLYRTPDGKYCVWRTGARFRRDNCDALAKMNEKGLDIYVHGERDDEVRAFMQEFRHWISKILIDLNIRSAEEMVYYSEDEFEGKIPFEQVMDQFSQEPDRKIYIPPVQSGKGRYVHPQKLLKAIYPNIEKLMDQYLDRRQRGLDLRMKELEIEKQEQEVEKARIDVAHHEKERIIGEQREAAEIRKVDAEAGQAKAEAGKAGAEAEQTRTHTKTHKLKVKGAIAGVLITLAVLVILAVAAYVVLRELTIKGVIQWESVFQYLDQKWQTALENCKRKLRRRVDNTKPRLQ